MENSKVDRFKKRQELKQAIRKKEQTSLYVADSSTERLLKSHLDSKVDADMVSQHELQLNEKYDFSLTDTSVEYGEVNQFIASLQSEYDKEKINLLVSDCKTTVLDSIIRPFGIGKYIVSKYDKEGGNIDTIYNVRKDVYSSDEERIKAKNNPEYDKSISHDYHSHRNYIEKNRMAKAQKDNNTLKDEYTGDLIKRDEKINLDHTISAKEIHSDRGRILSELNGVELANNRSNLNHTSERINKSKGQKCVDEFSEYNANRRDARLTEIKHLKSKDNLTKEEEVRLKKLNQDEKYNKDLAKEKDNIARSKYNREINKQYYTSKKFIQRTAVTSVNEGAKMGLQQAVGIVLKELTERIFDEVNDIYKNGFKGTDRLDKTFFEVLKERLTNIGNSILSKWKTVVQAFGEGFFSGLLSNLVTVIVNMFITTGKRVVRMIREGIFSLLKAIKLLLFPPKGMTFSEAAHEASKLLATGLAVTGGIMLEQYLDTLLKTIPFADMITTVISGIVTGLGTALLVYLIDRIDLLGIEKQHREDFVIQRLNELGDGYMDDTEALLRQLEVTELV